MTNLFHVLNRGVDKRNIFMDEQDYFRFIHDLFEFNDQERIESTFYIFNRFNDINSEERRKCFKLEKRQRKLLVNIHAFVLMPNHYHLMLSAKVDGGISKFIHKLNMGYAKYFNEKYKRQGALFQGKTKRIAIINEAHFIHLPYYLHLNPLDLIAPEWRDRELKDFKKTIKFLESYRWSSHMDYMGIKNFPSVTSREFLLEYFEGNEGYKNSIYTWLKNLNDFENLKEEKILLE